MVTRSVLPKSIYRPMLISPPSSLNTSCLYNFLTDSLSFVHHT